MKICQVRGMMYGKDIYMKIAILGRTQLLYNTALLLKKYNQEIVLICTCMEAPEYTVTNEEFKELAEKWNVPFIYTENINSDEVASRIEEVKPDIAVSVNWKTLIKKKTIDLFPKGILNGHCGDLPRYRGNACPNWAILNGEEEIGISIHYMDANELDAGDIVVKEKIRINSDTTITDIYEYMEKQVPCLFMQALNIIEKGEAIAEIQSKEREKILRAYPRIPSDSLIDWSLSNEDIARLVRASCAPFQGAYTYLNRNKVHILSVRIKEFEVPSLVIPGQVIAIDKTNDEAEIATGNGVIVIQKILCEGNTMKVSEVFKSTRMRAGYKVDDKIYEIEKRMEKIEEMISKMN